jgi:hypothetical protein
MNPIKLKLYVLLAHLLAPVFGMDSAEMLEELLGAGVLVFVAVIFDVYILGNQSLFNTTAGAPGYEITSVVIPIFQVVILVVCILSAVFILPKMVKKSASK